MKWFQYTQNNSGGRFHVDEIVSHYVLIQSPSSRAADSLAERVGIYFDGVTDGKDCGCCGDRWYRQYGGCGDDEPTVYGKPLSEYGEDAVRIYPFGASVPVSIADFEKNPPMVIEPS